MFSGTSLKGISCDRLLLYRDPKIKLHYALMSFVVSNPYDFVFCFFQWNTKGRVTHDNIIVIFG